MAIIKDGNLSGGLGDLVFGKDGRVRTEGKVTQSEATKKHLLFSVNTLVR